MLDLQRFFNIDATSGLYFIPFNRPMDHLAHALVTFIITKGELLNILTDCWTPYSLLTEQTGQSIPATYNAVLGTH